MRAVLSLSAGPFWSGAFLIGTGSVRVGDRAQVVIRDESDGTLIYLYMHNGGRELWQIVRDLLCELGESTPPRTEFTSGELAGRIFFRMAQAQPHVMPLYTISLTPAHCNHRDIVIDAALHEVEIYHAHTVHLPDDGPLRIRPFRVFTFNDFADLSSDPRKDDWRL